MSQLVTFKEFKNGGGFLVRIEDLKYLPLTESRSELAYISSKGLLTCWDWSLPDDALLIPFQVYFKLTQEEKENETGRDLLMRFYPNIARYFNPLFFKP